MQQLISPVAPARSAQVVAADLAGRLALAYADGGSGARLPLPRPFLGGARSGLHSVPQVGDWVLVHHEMHHYPNSVTCTTVDARALAPLAPAETVILHPDGRVACYLQNDGDTILLRTPAGAQISVDAGANISLSTPARLDIRADGGAYVHTPQGPKPIMTYQST